MNIHRIQRKCRLSQKQENISHTLLRRRQLDYYSTLSEDDQV